MKIDLTRDELKTLICSLSGNFRTLATDKRIVHQEFGEDFDEMYDELIKKIRRLQERLYDMLEDDKDDNRTDKV